MRFEVEADPYCWILSHYYEGNGKDGTIKEQVNKTYHANLDQVAKYVVHQFAAECKDMNELRDLFNKQAEELGKVVLMKSPQTKRVKK